MPNLNWTVKVAMSDKHKGYLYKPRSRLKRKKFDDNMFYPMSKWGVGYWSKK